MRRRLLIIGAFLLLAAAPAAEGAAAVGQGGVSLPPALLNVEWSLVTMNLGGRPAEDVTGAGMTITFSADGQVSGSGGCNRFSGGYTGDESGGLRIPGPLASTLILCEQAVSEREARYLSALPEVRGYALDGTGRLQLRFDQPDRQLIYVRPPGSMPQTGGGWGARQSLPRVGHSAP
jgi:heat shock protein HslJ